MQHSAILVYLHGASADEEAFKLLLELAGEEEAELEGELKEPDDISYIPASDGDESAENEDCNLLSNLADGIESLEQSRKGNPAVPGTALQSISYLHSVHPRIN